MHHWVMITLARLILVRGGESVTWRTNGCGVAVAGGRPGSLVAARLFVGAVGLTRMDIEIGKTLTLIAYWREFRGNFLNFPVFLKRLLV